MIEDHLTCPKCGYDLHGIPAIRCPECGFRYDAAALRSLAGRAGWARYAAARNVAMWSAIAAFLALPYACLAAGLGLGVSLAMLIGAYVVTFVGCVKLSGVGLSLAAASLVPILFIGIPLVLFRVSYSAPILLPVGSGMTLLHAWTVRFREWGELAPANNVRSAQLRARALRWSRFAMVALSAATLLLLIPLALT